MEKHHSHISEVFRNTFTSYRFSYSGSESHRDSIQFVDKHNESSDCPGAAEEIYDISCPAQEVEKCLFCLTRYCRCFFFKHRLFNIFALKCLLLGPSRMQYDILSM